MTTMDDRIRTYDLAITRAAQERELATRRAESAETEVQFLRQTLQAVGDWLQDNGYAGVLPMALVDQMLTAIEWSQRETI